MPTILRDEYVTINGITVCLKAFQVASCAPLLDGPKWRGDLTALPGIAGKVSFDDIMDATDLVIGVDVNGAWKWDDTAHSNPRQGLIDNFAYLKTNLGLGLASVTMVWHQPSGATKSGAIKIMGPYGSKKMTPSFVERTTFDITLLDGQLT